IPDGVLVRALAPKQTLPSVDAYNITFQWEFMKNYSLEAAYVGNYGRNVFVGDNPDLNVNQPTIVGFGTLSTNQRRPFSINSAGRKIFFNIRDMARPIVTIQCS
ncbi:MAG: hypothetical protein HC846_12995, partial [Blastocatellia bacterium]|nr:hypothetical protein [Blastocatellia bacterium]